MTERAGDRPQDIGRSHKRTAGLLDVRTAALLAVYRETLRRELEDLLAEIRPATGQLGLDGAVERPSLEARRALWDLAIKVARELAGGTDAGLEPAGDGDRAGGSASTARRRAPRLSARERRALGE